MEDSAIRAIIIGVAVFVTMLTLSAIILYYNTAKGIGDEVNKRTDIAQSYDNIMNTDNFEDTLTGVEIRSLINRYALDKSVEINIVEIDSIETKEYININNNYIQDGGWLVELNEDTSLISEEKLNLINPVWNNTVIKVEQTDKIILEIKLNVKN